jgi:hypothetical protein
MRAATLILTALVVLGPVGCQVWSVIPVTPLAAAEIEGNPRLVRLTLDDGTVVTLQSPMIERDSISGLIAESPGQGDRIAFPLTDVRQLDKRHISSGRTAALLAGIGAAGVVTFFWTFFAILVFGW